MDKKLSHNLVLGSNLVVGMAEVLLEHRERPLVQLPDFPVLDERLVEQPQEGRLLEGAVLRRHQRLLGLCHQELEEPTKSAAK